MTKKYNIVDRLFVEAYLTAKDHERLGNVLTRAKITYHKLMPKVFKASDGWYYKDSDGDHVGPYADRIVAWVDMKS